MIPDFNEADVAWLDDSIPRGTTPIGYVAAIMYLNEDGDPVVKTIQMTNDNLSTVVGMWELGKLDAVRRWTPEIFQKDEDDAEE